MNNSGTPSGKLQCRKTDSIILRDALRFTCATLKISYNLIHFDFKREVNMWNVIENNMENVANGQIKSIEIHLHWRFSWVDHFWHIHSRTHDIPQTKHIATTLDKTLPTQAVNSMFHHLLCQCHSRYERCALVKLNCSKWNHLYIWWQRAVLNEIPARWNVHRIFN